MNLSLARILSFLGHPLLVPTFTLLLMLKVNPFAFGAHHLGDQRTVVLLLYIVSTTFLIPALGVSLLRPLGFVRSLEMQDKQERIGPYIITGVFYLWMYINLSSTGVVPWLFSKFVLGATIALFVAFFVNIFFKISAHATGMGGFVCMAMFLALEWQGMPLSAGPLMLSLNLVLVAVVLLAGLVGVARLSLAAHSQPELWAGYAAGFGSVMFSCFLL